MSGLIKFRDEETGEWVVRSEVRRLREFPLESQADEYIRALTNAGYPARPASPAPEPPNAEDSVRALADGALIVGYQATVRYLREENARLLAERDALVADAAFAEWLRRTCSIVWQTSHVGGSDIKHTPHADAWASLRTQFENERRPPQAAMQRAERGTEDGS